MPSGLPMRCKQNIGLCQLKQVRYCKGCKKTVQPRRLMLRWEEAEVPYPPIPMQVFLLFLHFVAIENFRFING